MKDSKGITITMDTAVALLKEVYPELGCNISNDAEGLPVFTQDRTHIVRQVYLEGWVDLDILKSLVVYLDDK